MDQNLIENSIVNEPVTLEPSIRNFSSRIERILSNGVPLFAEEIGDFPSNAEKYFICTSSRELKEKVLRCKQLLNNNEWEQIENHRNNAVKNLEVLTNILSCIQKNFCDNIQYMSISQSYKMFHGNDQINKKSLCINEASKKELLLSLFRRSNTLKPFVKIISTQELTLKNNFYTHMVVLNTINELLPIWNVNLERSIRNEEQVYGTQNQQILFKIKIPLPPRKAFIKKSDENEITRSWFRNSSKNYFGDLFATLSFYNLFREDSEYVFKSNSTNTFATIKFTEIASHLIEDGYQLFVKFNHQLDERKIATSSKFMTDTPKFIKSQLAREIHDNLCRIHWVMIDRTIFYVLIQQIINIHKENPNKINIKELCSNKIFFSINKEEFLGSNLSVGHLSLEFQDILISYGPTVDHRNMYSSDNFDMSATTLLRDSFLEIWSSSIRLDIKKCCELNNITSLVPKGSSNLLEKWIIKLLQKYA